jgi:AraC-like DNA-binding protein
MNVRIAQKAHFLFENEGINKTFIKNVKTYKASSYEPLTNFIYDLCLVFVLQGKKIAHLNGNTFIYDCDNYLVIPTTLPLKCETHVLNDEPFLGIIVSIDKSKMNEVISKISEKNEIIAKNSLGIFSDSITDKIEGLIDKLIDVLASKEESEILGEQIITELYYRIAKGKNADFLYKMFLNSSNENKIAQALKIIHEGELDIDIHSLAKEVDMSDSSFYTHFKEVTSLTPLQYMKKIKLNKAKNLLLSHNYKIVEVSDMLGYINPSKFTRDFKSFFGVPPSKVEDLVSKENLIN